MELDFEVDQITNSIENVISGEVFETLVSLATKEQIIEKTDWVFDWKSEIRDETKSVFFLTTENDPITIHGMISLIDKGDHIFMNLIESAKSNKGKNKLYKGVAGNLVAFACKTSFEKGYDGIVSFIAKIQLIEHYSDTLGAKLFGKTRMYIDTEESYTLTMNYFKNFDI